MRTVGENASAYCEVQAGKEGVWVEQNGHRRCEPVRHLQGETVSSGLNRMATAGVSQSVTCRAKHCAVWVLVQRAGLFDSCIKTSGWRTPPRLATEETRSVKALPTTTATARSTTLPAQWTDQQTWVLQAPETRMECASKSDAGICKAHLGRQSRGSPGRSLQSSRLQPGPRGGLRSARAQSAAPDRQPRGPHPWLKGRQIWLQPRELGACGMEAASRELLQAGRERQRRRERCKLVALPAGALRGGC